MKNFEPVRAARGPRPRSGQISFIRDPGLISIPTLLIRQALREKFDPLRRRVKIDIFFAEGQLVLVPWFADGDKPAGGATSLSLWAAKGNPNTLYISCSTLRKKLGIKPDETVVYPASVSRGGNIHVKLAEGRRAERLRRRSDD